MKTTSTLRWKQDGYLHFAHAREGMYMVEQYRGRFIVTLDLAGAARGGTTQEMGIYKSLSAAKAGAQRDHRALAKLA